MPKRSKRGNATIGGVPPRNGKAKVNDDVVEVEGIPSDSLVQVTDELLSLRMPRCSVCGLDWFDDFEEEEGQGRAISIQNNNHDESLTMKCRKLLPLPRQ